ncbi:MAG: TPM domain-containing protein [Flavobacteriales bacterium]|nr:TPM domain-containing protein [Flavobacteriales bacterium]
MKAKDYFTKERLAALDKVIKAAEKETSGEVRLYVEDKCKEDVLDHAAFLFGKLDMHKTELRNGVLFYLAMQDRKFAILGDGGINAKVEDDFWDHIKEEMLAAFKQANFSEGLEKGISMAGVALSEHFPYQKDDVNELSDEIIIK